MSAYAYRYNIYLFIIFFCGVRGLKPEPSIYHVLSLSTELNSRGLSIHMLIIHLKL